MTYFSKSLTSTFLMAVGIIWAAVAAWQFYRFVIFRDAQGTLDVQGGGLNLWFAIGSATLACVCLCFAIFRRINQTEEFHITS